MSDLKDKKVVLTGAAGGVGRASAERFAKAGAILILTDVDRAGLEKMARELHKTHKAKVFTRVVNVSSRKEVEDFARWVLRTFKGVDILINNAGIGRSAELAETTLESWKTLMDINFWGPLYHVYAFLPTMIRQGRGHIVTVASGQAFFRLPTWGAYTISKLAIGAFSEMLRVEVKKFNINVTTLYPFLINTGFYNKITGENFFQKLSMKMMPYYSMSPQKVGKILFNAIRDKKGVEMVSTLNTIAKYVRVLPVIPDYVGAMVAATLGKRPEEIRASLAGRAKTDRRKVH